MKGKLSLIAGFSLAATLAYSAPLFEDSFQYSTGSLVDNSSGAWVVFDSGAGSAIQVINSASDDGQSLSSAALPASAGNRIRLINSGSGIAAAVLPETGGDTNESVYVSFLIKHTALPSGIATQIAGVSHSSHKVPLGKIYVRLSSGQVEYAVQVRTISAAVYAPEKFDANETVHITLKYTFGAGTDPDTASIFLNPEAATIADEGTPNATCVGHALEKAGTTGIDRFYVREEFSGSGNNGTFEFDEVRMALNWADAQEAPVNSSVTEWTLLEH